MPGSVLYACWFGAPTPTAGDSPSTGIQCAKHDRHTNRNRNRSPNQEVTKKRTKKKKPGPKGGEDEGLNNVI